MWKTILMVYVLGGILIYIATMIFCFKGWKQWERESEAIGYPEGAGFGIAAACTFFLGCMLFAIFWPALPFIMIGIMICDTAQSRKEKMRGDDEDGSENWPCEH